jgi:hypothetical protein
MAGAADVDQQPETKDAQPHRAQKGITAFFGSRHNVLHLSGGPAFFNKKARQRTGKQQRGAPVWTAERRCGW